MSSIYPCYPVCNWAMLDLPDSVFESTFAACFDCISAESESKGNSTYSFIISFLDQFYAGGIDFCRAVTPESIIVSSTSNIPLLFARTKGNDHQPMATRAVDFTTTLASDTVNVQSFSIPATTTLSTTTKTSAGSTASTTSYQYGFWLVYTFILCPTRTNSGPVTPQANGLDALWGCAPGYVCTPPQVNCDLEAGPPPFDFLCDAKDCLIAPTPPPAPSNVVVNGTSTIFSPLPLPTGLFNLDPAIFGADWGIFTGDVSVTSTLGSPTPSSNVTTTTSSIPTQAPTTPHSKAWIAGPVIGAIAGIAFFSLAIFYFLHRQRKNNQNPAEEFPQERAQLDGEGIKPKEMNDSGFRELDGEYVQPSEMDAGYAGVEMGRVSAIRRKPVASPEPEPGVRKKPLLGPDPEGRAL